MYTYANDFTLWVSDGRQSMASERRHLVVVADVMAVLQAMRRYSNCIWKSARRWCLLGPHHPHPPPLIA